MQKENLFFFSFLRPSKFGEAKVMKKSDLRLELDIVTPLTRSVCSAKRTKKDLFRAITTSLHPYSMCLFAIWGFYAKVSCRETDGFSAGNHRFLGRKLLKLMQP